MKRLALAAALFAASFQTDAAVWDLSREDVSITVESDLERIDPARDFTISVSATFPDASNASLPDLRDRFQGFKVAEDFVEDPIPGPDGSVTVVSRWRLVPEPSAAKYRLAPFAVADRFWTQPIIFEPPPPFESVTGPMELDPKPDPPPMDFRRIGIFALWALAAAFAVWLAMWLVRKARTWVRVRKMSPIERARYELDVLLGKGLPGRGLFKDFYVELTMVVRRYIGRRHNIKAPQLTTDEFLRSASGDEAFPKEMIGFLKNFLESADLVKFAGLDATPEMADGATVSAREYLESDDAAMAAKER